MQSIICLLVFSVAVSYSITLGNIYQSTNGTEWVERTYKFGAANVTIRRPIGVQHDFRGVLGFPNLFGMLIVYYFWCLLKLYLL